MAGKQGNNIFAIIKASLNGENVDFTTGGIQKAIILLAIPMLLEMVMESLFAIVDIFFVSKLGKEAISVVGLTESLLTIIYSIGIGISMAATAIVARRVGEKNYAAASKTGAQAIILGFMVSGVISLTGIFFAADLLSMMGGSDSLVHEGKHFTQIVLGSNVVIMLLFIINGIFRGAGNAAIAFRSLVVANGFNIIFCPVFIYAFGLTGAALATLAGRSIGVIYQFVHLTSKTGILQMNRKDYFPDVKQLKAILKIAWTGMLQFIIASGSWIFMVRIISSFGESAIAGYTIAIRVMIFFIMPAWGLSNAAATLVGQNLGAGQPERAEKSVWLTARYSAVFMILVTILFLFASEFILGFLSKDPEVLRIGTTALKIMSMGFVFYGIGMVMVNSFNGAGDTKTPTIINLFTYWCFQIPLAWILSHRFSFAQSGVFIAIIISESMATLLGIYIFRKGNWKNKKV
jgi:putative MATE family efflux protein